MLPLFNPDLKNEELLITEEEYHARKDLVHQSTLKNMIKSENAYYRSIVYPKQHTKSLRLGTLAHKAILEGKEFLLEYVVQPVFKGLTKDGVETTSMNAKSVQAKRDEWLAQLKPGTKIVEQKELDEIRWMLDSLVNHKFVQEVFKNGRPEVRGCFKDEKTDIGVAFADDFLSFDLDVWADLKTCQDSSHDGFRKSVEKFRYDLQYYTYSLGTQLVFGKKPKYPAWIAVESSEPFECRVHHVDDFYYDTGKYEFRKSMDKLKAALKSGKWPQAQSMIETVEPSPWFRGYYDLRIEE